MEYSEFLEFQRLDFKFENRNAVIVFPKTKNEKGSWLLKTEYFGAFPALETEMLSLGFHLLFIENENRWCIDDSELEIKARFCDYVIKEYGLASRGTPVGMSCGGLIAIKFAAKYPRLISSLYLDAPVINYLSCPANLGASKSDGWEEFHTVTGLDKTDLFFYREHPIDKAPLLIENKIPVMLVYGDADDVVPYSENGAHFEKYYKKMGGAITVISKHGCGHHPHGLSNNTPIVDFILKYAN